MRYLVYLKEKLLWLNTKAKEKGFQKKTGVILLLALGLLALVYLRYSLTHIGTDNGYINANVVRVAAQVSGRIKRLPIRNHQKVHQGDLLFQIDPSPYQLMVQQAEAHLGVVVQQNKALEAEIEEAAAQVATCAAELHLAELTQQRTKLLVTKKFLPPDREDQADATLKATQAALEAAEAHHKQSKCALGEPGDKNEQLAEATAALRQAKLRLSYTQVTAAAEGYIANLDLQEGSVIGEGIPLFALINSQSYWVDANFKETEIKGIKPGQRALIQVDIYPGHTFHGQVESINGSSGSAFSLLPPQNATGNWVKVTQRVPVKISLLDLDDRYPLRVGATASVVIAFN